MTKRFNWDGDILFDNKLLVELGNCLDAKDICDLLNSLNEENEQLKSELGERRTQLDFLKDENKHMKTVLEENKQLKQERLTWITNQQEIERLSKENEELEQQLQLKISERTFALEQELRDDMNDRNNNFYK